MYKGGLLLFQDFRVSGIPFVSTTPFVFEFLTHELLIGSSIALGSLSAFAL